MTTDLTTLIAAAMTEERAKYGWYGNILIEKGPPRKIIDIGPLEACEAHLEHLVADAVLRALHEAGLGIGQATGKDHGIVRGRNLIPGEPAMTLRERRRAMSFRRALKYLDRPVYLENAYATTLTWTPQVIIIYRAIAEVRADSAT